jgi:hypothetical protein
MQENVDFFLGLAHGFNGWFSRNERETRELDTERTTSQRNVLLLTGGNGGLLLLILGVNWSKKYIGKNQTMEPLCILL